MKYLFTFWIKMSSGDLNPCSTEAKSLHLAWAHIQKEIECSLKYVKRIEIEPLEPEEYSDTIVVNIVELASKLAHADVKQFYQHQEKKYLVKTGIPNCDGTVYSLEAQALFEQFYDEYYNKIKYAKL